MWAGAPSRRRRSTNICVVSATRPRFTRPARTTAGATIDLEHAGTDGAKKVECPLLVLWGQRGTVGRLYDVMKIWREHAVDVRGKALPSGHFLPEEVPEETLVELLAFLVS